MLLIPQPLICVASRKYITSVSCWINSYRFLIHQLFHTEFFIFASCVKKTFYIWDQNFFFFLTVTGRVCCISSWRWVFCVLWWSTEKLVDSSFKEAGFLYIKIICSLGVFRNANALKILPDILKRHKRNHQSTFVYSLQPSPLVLINAHGISVIMPRFLLHYLNFFLINVFILIFDLCQSKWHMYNSESTLN